MRVVTLVIDVDEEKVLTPARKRRLALRYYPTDLSPVPDDDWLVVEYLFQLLDKGVGIGYVSLEDIE